MKCRKPQFDSGSSSITIKGETLSSVTTLPRAELTRWLYSRLHAGEGAKHNFSDNFRANLASDICNGIEDDTVLVPKILWQGHTSNFYKIDNIRVYVAEGENEYIKLPRVRPNLSPGFVFHFGGEVSESNHLDKEDGGMRIYIASGDERYSISIWRSLISMIKEKNLSVSLKILSDSCSFPRSDSIVIYVNKEKGILLKNVLQVAQDNDNSMNMKKYNSLLATNIWGNVAVADHPSGGRKNKVSFGQDRCEAIAESIQNYFLTGTNFLDLLKFRFSAHKTSPNNLSESL